MAGIQLVGQPVMVQNAAGEAMDLVALNKKIDDVHNISARQSTAMLFWGLFFTTSGLVSALALLIKRQSQFVPELSVNMDGQPFPSGMPYWPSSVSEMIHRSGSPEEKVATAGSVVGCILLWMSYYPIWLSNVNVGESIFIIPCCNCPTLTSCNMLTLRNILLPAGVLIVIFAPVSDMATFTAQQAWVTKYFHTLAIALAVVVHIWSEIYTLFFAKGMFFTPLEKLLRVIFFSLAIVSAVCYTVGGAQSTKPAVCCHDTYKAVTLQNIHNARAAQMYLTQWENEVIFQMAKTDPGDSAFGTTWKNLYDTAAGAALTWKLIGMFGEFFMLMFVLAGLWTIFVFAPQRWLPVPGPHPTPYSYNQV